MDVIIELFEATSSGDLEKVKEYKNIKKVINKLFPKKITDIKYEYLRNKHLLYVACENGHCNIAQYLIEKGAKLERQTYIRERCRGPPMMAPYLRHHRTALHIAILNHHDDCIQLILKTNNKEIVRSEGFNAKYTWMGKIIGRVWIHKYYPIHLAIFTLNVSLVHQLLDLGTDIELKESSLGATPFLCVFNKLNRGDIVGYDAADEFHDIDILERSKSDREMSATATFTKEDKTKQREIISLLVARGVNIHAVDRKGRNAVHFACLKADIELLQQAIKLGIDPKLPDAKGNTGFHCIVKKFFKGGRSAEIAKILGKAGVDIDAKNEDGYSALHLCVLSEKDRTECASVLLDNHADINLLDEKGVPPLAHALARHSRKQLVKSLLTHPKLDKDYRDKEGNTYFHFFALNNSRLDFAYELKGIGLFINATNNNNITPLHIAVMKRSSVVEDLMDNGASMNLVDSQGNTPTHLSLYETKQETLYKLVRAGADVNIPNNKGKTVLQLMSSKTRKELEL